MAQILNNASATSAAFQWNGGNGVLTVHAGTWGGGTVKLQVLGPDNSTYLDVGPDTTLTADGGGAFRLGPCTLRVNVATATGVYANVDNSDFK